MAAVVRRMVGAAGRIVHHRMNAVASPPPIPLATYRLQFNAAFTFEDARRIVGYLSALGVSHVYASPLLLARPGSAHGYDIVDHSRLNPEIGEPADFDRFVDELHRHGMGLVVDFVPNHMGVGPDNPWWTDVLEWGEASPYSAYFDIDWKPLEPTLAGKILLPVLADHYGAVLERGELQLRFDEARGSFTVVYQNHPFPLTVRSYARILQSAASRSTELRLGALANGFRACFKSRAGPHQHTRRGRVEELKRELAATVASNAAASATLAATVRELNGIGGRSESFDALHRLIEEQAYRLAYWRVAAHEINYRRFFDINDLAGLNMEQRELFEAAHALIRRLIAADKVQGLRLDHVDGLRDPKGYFERVQTLVDPSWRAERPGRPLAASTARAPPQPVYVVVEKILARHETLRSDWPVAGTTGYEFMSAVNGVFVDHAAERYFRRRYWHMLGRILDFDEIRTDAKRKVMRESLTSELNVLANLFNRLAKERRETRDYSLPALRQALEEVIVHFPVYRTYVSEKQTATAEDRRDLEWAVGKARKAATTADSSIYDFVRDVLSLDLLEKRSRGHARRDVINAALKFQQYTGPVTAKAVEDTAFYRYMCLASLNDVGGEPDRFGISVTAFHELNRKRLREHPFSLLATATHDHKRGEDVRARLNVLSEIPREWWQRVARWTRLNAKRVRPVDDATAPSRNDEYLFYQTVVGIWPYGLRGPEFEGIDRMRVRVDAYMQKAAREAKMRTSWSWPNEGYETALAAFVGGALDPKQARPFLDDLSTFVERIAPAGAVNGLAQTVLKLTCPGVPDLYQGCELWDLSLVDPDNRRPVDFETRERAILQHGEPQDLLASWRDGRIKQYLVQHVLRFRREKPALFATGAYQAIETTGNQAHRAFAFARTLDGETLVVVVPRLASPLLREGNGLHLTRWDDTIAVVPEAARGRRLIDLFTDSEIANDTGELRLAEILGTLPVAVLRSA
jgi:(1->4)-alpha-D-glucan 1-alpha-D-glucosylmutase